VNFDVIKYWDSIRSKTGDLRHWNELTPQLQQMVISSINQLLFVLTSDDKS